jgi:hypothetical protein
MADYGAVDPQSAGFDDHPDYSEAADPESPPAPWYRKRSLLAVWATMVAILVVLIIYGLIQISHGGGGTSTTTPSTTPTGSSTTTPSTTPPSTTTTAPPSSTPGEEAPPGGNAPPPAGPAPSAEPPHHHHLPHIPSTIPLPHTTITLPHGF